MKRLAWRAVALTVLGATLSVVAATPHELRTDAAFPSLLGAAATPVATTYRVLITGMRKCYDLSSFIVQPYYFTDTGEARIDVREQGFGLTFVTVDLRQKGTGTAIEVRFDRASLAENVRNSIFPWANGEPGYCMFARVPRAPDPSRPQ